MIEAILVCILQVGLPSQSAPREDKICGHEKIYEETGCNEHVSHYQPVTQTHKPFVMLSH